MSNLLTVSRARVYRECPQKHDYMYLQGYFPRQRSDANKFGDLWHKVLENGFEGVRGFVEAAELNEASGESEYEVFAGCAEDSIPDDCDPYDRARIRALLVAYVAAMKEILFLENHEILAVEAPFSFPHVNPDTGGKSPRWLRAGKIDVVVRHRNSKRVRVMEHKTTTSPIEVDSVYWQNLSLDTQVSQYVLGAEVMFPGLHVDECAYDVVRKFTIRPKKATKSDARKWRKPVTAAERILHAINPEHECFIAKNYRRFPETPEEFYERCLAEVKAHPGKYARIQMIPRTESSLLEHLREMWSLSQSMRESENHGWSPKNPEACHRYRETCPFWLVCVGQTALTNQNLYERLDNVHPELAGSDLVKEEEHQEATA